MQKPWGFKSVEFLLYVQIGLAFIALGLREHDISFDNITLGTDWNNFSDRDIPALENTSLEVGKQLILGAYSGFLVLEKDLSWTYLESRNLTNHPLNIINQPAKITFKLLHKIDNNTFIAFGTLDLTENDRRLFIGTYTVAPFNLVTSYVSPSNLPFETYLVSEYNSKLYFSTWGQIDANTGANQIYEYNLINNQITLLEDVLTGTSLANDSYILVTKTGKICKITNNLNYNTSILEESLSISFTGNTSGLETLNFRFNYA